MLRVEYEQTKADLTRFWFHHVLTAPYVRRFVIVALAVASLADGMITYLRWAGRPEQLREALWSIVMTPLVALPVGLVLGPVLLWIGATYSLRESSRGLLGRHTIVIDDFQVREETSSGEQVVRWGAVHRVEQTARYILIYVHAMAAHVIPRAAFQDEADAASFFAQAHAFWSAASREEELS